MVRDGKISGPALGPPLGPPNQTLGFSEGEETLSKVHRLVQCVLNLLNNETLFISETFGNVPSPN